MAWPGVPEELLAGPRGRRLCFELVNPWPERGPFPPSPGWLGVSFGAAGASPQQLAAELAGLAAAADLTALAAATEETSILAPLRGSVDAAMYWQPPDEVDQALAEPRVAEALGPVARAVSGWPAAAWWSSSLSRPSQQFVEVLDPEWARGGGPKLAGAAGALTAWRASVVAREREAATLPADPAAPYSGHWWSTPAHAGLVVTSRALPGLGALGLELIEDAPGWHEAACWQLLASDQARVYEIGGPQDWSRLVARYPLDVSKSRRHDWWRVTGWAGAWVIPDYAAVAADFDAIHVTVGGYLTTAGRALALADQAGAGGFASGARTVLAGWAPDATYWLADVLTSSSPPERWLNREPLGWQRAR